MYEHIPRRVSFESLCRTLAEGPSALEVLPEEVASALESAPQPLAIMDFAGRDSVAAAVAWLSENSVGTVLPVGDVVPTRFGDWSVYDDNWTRLRDELARRFPSVLLAPWFVLEDGVAWRYLNARYISELVRLFGFYSPCLGCHLHFYAMRAVLAKAVGATVLVSGEKELHGRKRKANQTHEAVDGYRALSKEYGIDHRFPVHHVTSEEEILRLVGDAWREGERELKCAMSGNDQSTDGTLLISREQIRAFMHGFAVPMAIRIVEARKQCLGNGDFVRHIDAEASALLQAASR